MTGAWQYTAAAPDGRLRRGTLRTSTRAGASELLEAEGLTPVDITIAPDLPPRAIPLRDATALFQSLSTLVQAGLPLERALAATEEIVGRELTASLGQCRNALAQGLSLADALGQMDRPAPTSAIALVRAGERTGRLGDALAAVAAMLEQQADLRARMSHALAYPFLLAVTGTVSIAVITTVVIPRFAALLDEAGQALPPATAALLAISLWARSWWWAVLLLVVAGLLLVRRWRSTASGRLQWDSLWLRVPGIGALRLAMAGSRSLHTMGAALDAGMTVVPALKVAADASADAAVASRFERAATSITEGQPIARSLERVEALPPIASQFLALGEASGRLALMAQQSSRVLSQETERRLATLIRFAEPMLILLFGGLVALVAGALLQAVYSLRPGGV